MPTASLKRIGPARPASAAERLIVALDYPNSAEALALVDRLGPRVSWYKVGMELFYATGPGFIAELTGRGKRVFLDLKLHDIPNTMSQAVRSLARLDVGLTTVHVPAGREALLAVMKALSDLPADKAPGVLGVTRLTSLPAPDAAHPWDDVVELAGLAVECGLYGWIAPVPAAGPLRRAHGVEPVLVCPGIRLPEGERGDQVAIGTPDDAVRGGADWIVVGRPITQASVPEVAAEEVIRRLESVETAK